MNFLKQMMVIAALAGMAFLSGCSPEVGSDKWCKQLQEKPKGDWTANEAADFTKHCILK
jgi:protein involved in sex pheromone biosynthesis